MGPAKELGAFLIGIRFQGEGRVEKKEEPCSQDQGSSLDIPAEFKKIDWQKLGQAKV